MHSIFNLDGAAKGKPWPATIGGVSRSDSREVLEIHVMFINPMREASPKKQMWPQRSTMDIQQIILS